jgi:hypothetical protein
LELILARAAIGWMGEIPYESIPFSLDDFCRNSYSFADHRATFLDSSTAKPFH